MVKKQLCYICKEREVRRSHSNYSTNKDCIVCYHKQLNKKCNEYRVKKEKINKNCEICKEAFVTTNVRQLYCGESCRKEGALKNLNNQWVDRDYKERAPMTEGQRWKQEQGHLYEENPKMLKRFKAVRG